MIQDPKAFLQGYSGPPLRLMEICGTHTAEISRCGLPSLLPAGVRLISGPGCPVCVTVSAYIDRLAALSLTPGTTVLTFGDLMRVPGSGGSLAEIKAKGGSVEMVYSPLDALPMAQKKPERTYIFAAVGFETTAPVYARLLERAAEAGVQNLKLLTALKTMPQAIRRLCQTGLPPDGFLAPGHVAVITGAKLFRQLAKELGIPFVVAGFTPRGLLAAVAQLVSLAGKGVCENCYPSAVAEDGNPAAREAVSRWFTPCDSAWRGMGVIPGSGLCLRPEHAAFDAGSAGLFNDAAVNTDCRCAEVLTGRISPYACPLFGKSCHPLHPQGACMVSTEGSCFHYYINHRNEVYAP